jgi:hypothetical protein
MWHFADLRFGEPIFFVFADLKSRKSANTKKISGVPDVAGVPTVVSIPSVKC